MKKSAKILLIFLAILIIFIVIGAIIFNSRPLTKIQDNYDFENNLKYENLEDVELDYDVSKMVEDKCYIVLHASKIYNIDRIDDSIVYNIDELDNFIKNVENNNSDEIRIVEYTLYEQQPILIDLQYKDNTFIMQIDNRRDGAISQEDKKIVTTEYDGAEYVLAKNEESDNASNYELILKSKKSDNSIHICNYVEAKKADNTNFEIQFNKNENGNEVTKILDKNETDKYDYNIYSYKGTADIIINNKKMSLRDALINNKITIDEILEQANKDVNELRILESFYLDGGSKHYLYEDFSILSLNTLSGNNDIYIGAPSMNINDINYNN